MINDHNLQSLISLHFHPTLDVNSWSLRTWTTSATRFLLFGSAIGGINNGTGLEIGGSYTILPNIVPFSRMIFVRALVSISYMPGMFCFFIQLDNVLDCRQWLGVSQISPTTRAAVQIRCDSNQLQMERCYWRYRSQLPYHLREILFVTMRERY